MTSHQRPGPGPAPDLRVRIHDHMAAMAEMHAASAYPGVYDGDTAGALFALLTDAGFAYEMEVSADALDPGQLGHASGLTARQTLLTGLGENLDMKAEAPAMCPVNGWTAWRLAPAEGDAAAAGGGDPGAGAPPVPGKRGVDPPERM